ncbi:hypothetical protein Goari_019794 [Gossypium aridum]|uniref:Uncharacterized protein n=1 Tax=Gossypium aridum TaxID=34290 RepID=A0A7J8WV61_GOSAI|nr:hypothetical protein [Gossypium aridum]
MATSLIHFDGKYISTTQVVMADGRALEGIIHYLATPLITELRVVSLVVTTISTSLSEQLIHVLVRDKVEPWVELRRTTRPTRRH